MVTPTLPPIPASHLTSTANPTRRFRLLEQVRRALRVRHYSKRTEITYCAWIRRFVLFHGRRHSATMGEEEIAGFLNHLATTLSVSASTQNQALHSLLFLYRHVLRREMGLVPGLAPAKRGRRLPVVLSVSEVRNDPVAYARGTQTLLEFNVWKRVEAGRVHESASEGHRLRSRRDYGAGWKGRQGSTRSVAQTRHPCPANPD